MSDKDARKDPGVHFHSGSEAAVDDLRPKGRRSARPADDTSSAPEASTTVSDELPVPDARPAPEDTQPPSVSVEAEAPAEPAKKGNAKQTMPATPRAKGIPAQDARLPDVEKALARGDWPAVVKLLAPTGAPNEPKELPASLRLLWAIATKEASTTASTAVDVVAIEAVAELLDVSKQSPVALVLAKRALRRRAWASAPAPSAAVSTFIIVGGLAIGLGLGWLAAILLY